MKSTATGAATLDLSPYQRVAIVHRVLLKRFPYFSGILQRQFDRFGSEWLEFFETELDKFFGDDEDRVAQAVDGYGRFALDAMRLQVEFEKTREYRNKTYEEAADEVYQNREYMFGLYLPGILLSHCLWPHHYHQHVYFMERFLPYVRRHGGRLFYDVGVGTGFYSKEMLRHVADMHGVGFDLSPFSLEHTTEMIEAWGLGDRYEARRQDIIESPPDRQAPFLINIEVLEHLEDPQGFLVGLAQMMEPGGFGLISVAITAPNADHIYLYNSAQEAIDQIERAGFTLVDHIEEAGYEPRKPGDSVPTNGAFIVTK